MILIEKDWEGLGENIYFTKIYISLNGKLLFNIFMNREEFLKFKKELWAAKLAAFSIILFEKGELCI